MNKTEKVTIKNVVYIRETTIDVFPFGWDCRALASALEVVWLENNEFKREIYMVDTRFGYDCPADEVELEWVDNGEEMQEMGARAQYVKEQMHPVKIYKQWKHYLEEQVKGN